MKYQRKRYIVKLVRNGEPIQVVVRLYDTFLTDEKGKDVGTISFEEVALSSNVKEELYTPTSNS
ncbi:hypothetical protein [Fictibacillus sp. S7]|uniref:hypothetical protein n=1 Tax=Fictibacillus sp. S7 TaxID=2212476 RepID=UPI001011124E|nr:hypothetical protein [Fictibacillus sp. S7]RXY98911.1 hypothetical protein DMO16_04040 [Fictibacillus sp. S7]